MGGGNPPGSGGVPLLHTTVIGAGWRPPTNRKPFVLSWCVGGWGCPLNGKKTDPHAQPSHVPLSSAPTLAGVSGEAPSSGMGPAWGEPLQGHGKGWLQPLGRCSCECSSCLASLVGGKRLKPFLLAGGLKESVPGLCTRCSEVYEEMHTERGEGGWEMVTERREGGRKEARSRHWSEEPGRDRD